MLEPVGLKHGGVDLVMDLGQNRDQPGLMKVPLGLAHRLPDEPRRAQAQLFERVVKPGHGDEAMRGNALLAERVELLAEFAQTPPQGRLRMVLGQARIEAGREGEGVEDARLHIDAVEGIDPRSCRHWPGTTSNVPMRRVPRAGLRHRCRY